MSAQSHIKRRYNQSINPSKSTKTNQNQSCAKSKDATKKFRYNSLDTTRFAVGNGIQDEQIRLLSIGIIYTSFARTFLVCLSTWHQRTHTESVAILIRLGSLNYADVKVPSLILEITRYTLRPAITKAMNHPKHLTHTGVTNPFIFFGWLIKCTNGMTAKDNANDKMTWLSTSSFPTPLSPKIAATMTAGIIATPLVSMRLAQGGILKFKKPSITICPASVPVTRCN